MINDFSTCVMSVKHAGWTTCMSAECLKAVSIGGDLHPVPFHRCSINVRMSKHKCHNNINNPGFT